MTRPTYQMTLKQSEMLAPRTLGLTFQVREPPTFEAGQFISIVFNHEGESFKRSYSIASTPDQLSSTGELEIAVGLIDGGRASSYFQAATPGQVFEMSGPFGLLTLSALSGNTPKRIIFVGTGTGMAPYRSMLPQLISLGEKGINIHLLMGARRQEDLFFHSEFRSSCAITFESCLSQVANPYCAKGEYTGYVQDRLVQLNPVAGDDVVYLCGNPNMIDDCVALLMEHDFRTKDIKREKYTFSR